MTSPDLPYLGDEKSFTSDLISHDNELDYPEKLNVSWKGFLISGGGFMVDQYNLFVIGTVILTMSVTPGLGEPTLTQGSVARAIKLVGAIVGQLTFGWVADRVGRKKACLCTLLLVIFGAVGSATSVGAPGFDVYWCLSVWQLVLGIGVGGEYPLSASMSRESTSDLRSIGLTFCMQGFGFLLGPVVLLVLLEMYPGNTAQDLNKVWRYALCFSAIPAALLLIPRSNAHNSQSYTNIQNTSRFNSPLVKVLGKNSWRRLLGTAGSWFLFDVSFYGNSILAAQAFSAMGLTGHGVRTPHEQIASAAWCLMVVALVGIPGYFAAIYALPSMGLRSMQTTGFMAISVLFAVIGIQYDTLGSSAFLALYGLTFFFSNFGPNFTTFVLPAVLFDTSVRARCHGISAAAGKLGGAVGVYGISSIMSASPDPMPTVCMLCSICSAAGLLLTIACIDERPEAVARSYDRKEQRAFAATVRTYGTV